MEKTKIATFDSTWNPVSGCKHGCEFCYARKITDRFGGVDEGEKNKAEIKDGIYIVTNPLVHNGIRAAYPFGFEPTLYRYRMDEYKKKSGRMIFVCSTADLFGEWIPDWLIKEVFDACLVAPQHSYMFLTKNPKRYMKLYEKGLLPTNNCMWYGFSNTKGNMNPEYLSTEVHSFISIEPLLGRVSVPNVEWVIIGAETGNRKDKVVPEKVWVEEVLNDCKVKNIPVFMKPSLLGMFDTIEKSFPNGVVKKKDKIKK